MNATFKRNLSFDNKIYKSFSATTATYDVYFLDACSISAPQIIVAADFAGLSMFNYLEIGEPINRKYFVRDMVSLDGERVQISAAVDVLSTYADDVLSARVLTGRGTKNINLFVPDEKLKNSVRGIPQIKTLTGGEWTPTITADMNCVVISNFGGGVQNG